MRRYSGALSAAFFLPKCRPGRRRRGGLLPRFSGPRSVARRAGAIGININWLGSASWSKPSVILAGSWQWIGFCGKVLVAALRAVPDEYTTQPRSMGLDWSRGSGMCPCPRSGRLLVFVLTVNTIGTMQLFDVPFLLFGAGGGGGPLDSAPRPRYSSIALRSAMPTWVPQPPLDGSSRWRS